VYKVFKEVKDTQRWLMLSEECPDVTLRVISAEEKPKYVVLNCESLDKEDFSIAVFDRDVKKCVKEWGVNPKNWAWFHPLCMQGKNRFELVPCDPQPNKVEYVIR
jgi:hypothetical protein